jgi:hypothetical protein
VCTLCICGSGLPYICAQPLMCRVGQIRMSGFQIPYIRIFKYRIYVCPLHPRSVACSFADLEGFTIPSSFPPPPPFVHFSLHTSPSTPSVTSLTITGFLRPSNLWLRIAQNHTARIRRIYGNTPYIAVYTPYKYVHSEIRNSVLAGGGWKIWRIYRTV